MAPIITSFIKKKRNNYDRQKNKRFSCEKCSVVCSSRIGLDEHVRKHSGERPYTCDHCSKSFKRKLGLSKHIQLIHASSELHVEEFHCTECSVSSKILGNVVRHYLCVHRKSRRFICSICASQFNQNQELKSHLRSKHNVHLSSINSTDKKSICEIYILPTYDPNERTEAILSKLKELEKDEQRKLEGLQGFIEVIKANAKPNSNTVSLLEETETGNVEDNLDNVVSDHCQEIRQTESDAQNNNCSETWISVIFSKPDEKIKENGTPEGIVSGDNIIERLRELNVDILLGSNNPKQCDKCGKVFLTKKKLLRHIKTHNVEKPYKCNKCNMMFKEKSNLLIHYRMHDGSRPYVCPECGKQMRYHKDFKDHFDSHSGLLKYACEICNRKFVRRRDCIRHKMVHNPEYRFKCSTCGKGFSRRYMFENHKLQHQKSRAAVEPAVATAKRSFQCTVCAKVYKTQQGLDQHTRKHTGTKDHQCHICSKTFISAVKLQIHLRNHIPRVKNVSCSDCQRKFSSQDTLMIHTARYHKPPDTTLEHFLLPATEVSNYEFEVVIGSDCTLETESNDCISQIESNKLIA